MPTAGDEGLGGRSDEPTDLAPGCLDLVVGREPHPWWQAPGGKRLQLFDQTLGVSARVRLLNELHELRVGRVHVPHDVGEADHSVGTVSAAIASPRHG